MEIIDQSYEVLTDINRDTLVFLERCGRVAYKSEDKIVSGSAERFISSIFRRGHESVIEHFCITVKFITDRGITHELVRHRLASYTQESTRYCNYSKKGFTVVRPEFWRSPFDDRKYARWLESMYRAEEDYNYLIEEGATPQEARSILPNSLKTEIVCTANIREWRHILKLRTSQDAHPQMRALMISLLKELKERIPILFGDI